MGDWGIATWWGTGSPPRLPNRLGGDDRWAVRLGRDRGLWQMDTLSKWGVRSPTLRGHSQVVGVLPAVDEVFTREQGPLVAGFSCLVERAVPRRTAGRRGQAPDLLAGAADLLGAGSAAVVEDEGHPMLCLSQPVVVPAPVVEWPLDQLHRQPESARALFEALALAAPHGVGRCPRVLSAGAVLGFCCARRSAAPTIRHRAGTPGEYGEDTGMQELERITARRSELDALAEEPASGSARSRPSGRSWR
ncbi:hypothetical protein [Streptomyces sp. NPDC001933]|uniref:hypothetical protein n=1 Tax=Streptomyces sp. NPDC001933 TaxID=3364626 RepID=UPI0036AF4AD9